MTGKRLLTRVYSFEIRTQRREEVISRLSCARSADVALSYADIPEDEREKRLFDLATRLQEWVKEAAWARPGR